MSFKNVCVCVHGVCVFVCVFTDMNGARRLPRVLVLPFHMAETGILFIPVHTGLAGPRVSEGFPGSSSISQWKCSEYRCVLSNSAWTWVLRSKLKSSPLCGKHLSLLDTSHALEKSFLRTYLRKHWDAWTQITRLTTTALLWS